MVPFSPSTIDPVKCAAAHGLGFFARLVIAVREYVRLVGFFARLVIAVREYVRLVGVAYVYGTMFSGR